MELNITAEEWKAKCLELHNQNKAAGIQMTIDDLAKTTDAFFINNTETETDTCSSN